jgi:teichuronic acid biosynthesis glycosyltransferase TuaG
MVKLSKLEQQKLDEMVKEFDWQFYVSYYDGLESLIKNESMAKHHFKNYGFKEGRICCQKQVINLEIPERTDYEIRLIYCGTLRDEENILEIIEEFQKIHKEKPEVVLKIVYGKIHGDSTFTKKVNEYIKNGVKGITFKHNLSHRDACYEIATSDIGICWRKNGWGDNGEVSTKVKEYEMYGLEILNDLKIKVGIVTSTNKLNKIDNIIRNFKQQFYFNKKLFLVLNNNDFDVNYVQKQMTEHNILYEIINLDEKFNLGHCLNEAIKKLKQQNYDIFAKFDDDDIYEKYYLLEQVYNLNKYHNCIVGKYNVPLFIPEHNNFYTIDNFTKNNQFAEICRGSTIMFNINDVEQRFDTEKIQGIDSIFLKQHISNGGKIYVTSFDNYIWIRHLDKNKHTWNLDITTLNLIKYIPNQIPGGIFNIIFDKIYVVNLLKDENKKNYFITNNSHTHLDFSFFEAIKGANDEKCKEIFENYMNQPIGYNGCSELEKRNKKKMITKVGQIGYLRSMLNIFLDALKNKYKRIIIFDDDAILHKNFVSIFFDKFSKLMDKHIIRIGTTHHSIKNFKTIEPYYETPDCDGSFAICYKSECFQYFIDNIKDYNIPFDSGVCRDYKNKTDNAVDFTIYPFLCIADTFESGITNERRNIYDLANKLKWKLDNFNFVSTLRKISVIIPLHNKEKTVILSIKSILNQTYKNIEIIIVDDNSSDNSVHVINKFLENYNGDINIKLLVHEMNKGCYAARNTGIKNATGHYIAFQDPDDFSFSNRLKIQLQDIITKNVSISFSQIYRMNNNDISSIDNLEYEVIKDKNLKKQQESIWDYSNKLGMVTSLIDINIFNEYGLYEENIRHSLDLWYLQKVYIKKFNLNLENSIYAKVNVKNKKGAFHSFIILDLDKNNFIYNNKSLQYVCSIMDKNNITNTKFDRDKDYEEYFHP